MAGYDFKTLSPIDFEELVRDLIQAELGTSLECFRQGRDSGIDLRSAMCGDGQLVVQCKHYANSTVAQLISRLASDEVPRVARLKPNRYILATSLGLTPANKEKVCALFHPYCRDTGDVFGCDDLNNLLRKFPKVERDNFKLWLTSKTVLDQLLHSRLYSQATAEVAHIEHKRRLYVRNESFDRALDLLEESHVCIIAGIPGIGKTTLAEMLLLHYMDAGFEIAVISHDVEDGFAQLRPGIKQVFYYDDFLGQSSLDEKLGKNEDRRLERLIAEVKKSSNRRFILTTREYILRRAERVYEPLARCDLSRDTCVVVLDDYCPSTRARILYNHLYYAGLPRDLLEEFVGKQVYDPVIRHPNFNPRIIEWAVESVSARRIPSSDFAVSLLSSLENPETVWRHAVERQLSTEGKHLLFVLRSLPAEVMMEQLSEAFAAFHSTLCVRLGISRREGDFRSALRELDGVFVSTQAAGSRIVVKFHNPSIADFMKRLLCESPSILESLVREAVFFEQLERIVEVVGEIGVIGEVLQGAVARVWEKPSCEFRRGAGREVEYSSVNATPEWRLEFVIRAWRALRSGQMRTLVRTAVARVFRRCRTGAVVPWLLDNAFRHCAAHAEELGLRRDKFLKAIGGSDSLRCEPLSAFRIRVEVLVHFSPGISDEWRDDLCREFLNLVDEEIDVIRGDRELRQYAGNTAAEVDAIGRLLNADVRSYVEKLDDLAIDPDDRMIDEDRDALRNTRGRVAPADHYSGDLFATLLECVPPTVVA